MGWRGRWPRISWHGWMGFGMCGDVAATAAGDGRRAAVGGAVAGTAVRAALGTASAPLTVREIAALTGMRRDAVGRILRLGERSGWACRERGDMRQGVGDSWSAAADDSEDVAEFDRSARAKMKAAPGSVHAALDLSRAAAGRKGEQPPTRLARGELQGLVLAILRERAPQSFSVVVLARLTGGRSQGAVADACERLVRQDDVLMTFDGGRRYAARDQVSDPGDGATCR